MTAAKSRGRVVRLDGHHADGRRTVTYRTYLDGRLLGNAYSEDEGWRWIADMIKMGAQS